MDWRKTAIGAIVVMLLIGAAWALGWLGGTDSEVAELQALQAQMFGSELPEAQRQLVRDQFRQRVEGLTDVQRRALFSASRDAWRQRAEQRMDEFFTLSSAEQTKRLDEMLNRIDQRQNERRQNSGAANRASRGNGDRRGGRNMTEAQRDARAKRRLDRTSPKQRAQWAAFRQKLEERARQRGIDPGALPGRGGRGRWGRMA
jgi:hypothetical protein